MTEGLTGRWVTPASLSRYNSRYLTNRMYAAIKQDAWKSHTRPYNPESKHQTIGGASFDRPEPSAEHIESYLSAWGTFADDDGTVYDAFVLYTDWTIYSRFFLPDIAADGLLDPWLGLLANPRARRPFYAKRPDDLHREARMVRNGRVVSDEAATACERLIRYCSVFQLSARSVEEFCNDVEDYRAKRLPDLVVPIIKVAAQLGELSKVG